MRIRQRRARLLLALAAVCLLPLIPGERIARAQDAGAGFPDLDVRPLRGNPALSLGASESQPRPRPTDARGEQIREFLRLRIAKVRAAQDRLGDGQADAVSRLRKRAGEPVRVRVRGAWGTPRQIRGKRLRGPVRNLASADSDRELETAYAFLEENSELLRVDDPRAEFVLERKVPDPQGGFTLRFRQQYKGLPVWPTGLLVHLDAACNVVMADGGYVPTPANAVVVPLLDADEAAQRARAEIGRGAIQGAPELGLFVRGIVTPRLVWKLVLRVSLLAEMEVVVSALDGSVLSQRNLVAHENVAGSGVDLLGITRSLNTWQSGGEYTLIDTTKPMYDANSTPPDFDDTRGAIVILDAANTKAPVSYVTSNSPTSGLNADGVSAAWSFGQVYDYFLAEHGRDSFDGDGATITGIVRFDSGHMNASWNSGASVMVFGDGDRYAASLDVVGHELSHAVVTYSANLEYLGQSGALNESFSDIFGELIEARALGANDWKMGSSLSSPLRDLRDPGSVISGLGQPYPARMSEYFDLPDTTDFGGVHINSSIFNHGFYLLAEGMNGAIGLTDAGRIYYRALTQHLTKNSLFKDARLACVASAEELFGVTSAQALRTAEAFDLIEIGSAAPSNPTEVYSPVNAADSTLFLFFDAGSGKILLGRRDAAAGDGALGVTIDPAVTLAAQRFSVSGDGTFGVCVTESGDVGFIDIYGADDPNGEPNIELVGLTTKVAAVAMDPSGDRYAFVFLDSSGIPTNEVTIVDTATNTGGTVTLEAAVVDGGAVTSDIVYADAMVFTSDGRFLVYDALNRVGDTPSTQTELWSIYALDIASGQTISVVPPFAGLQIGNPALAQTSDDFMTFDVQSDATGETAIFAANLATGDVGLIATVMNAFGIPRYTGDDSAIVYQVPDSSTSGFSLFRRSVANRVTSSGAATAHLSDAGYGVIYRNGTFTVPNAPPEGTIDTPVSGVTIQVGDSVSFAGSATDPNAHVPLTYAWNFGGGAASQSAQDPGAVQFNTAGVYTVRFTTVDSKGLADPTPATRTVVVEEPAAAPSGGGGGGCTVDPDGRIDPWILLMIGALWVFARRGRGKVA